MKKKTYTGSHKMNKFPHLPDFDCTHWLVPLTEDQFESSLGAHNEISKIKQFKEVIMRMKKLQK